MVYECPRCGYKTKQRGDIKKHFNRKKICSAISRNMPIEKCIEEVLGTKNSNILIKEEKYPHQYPHVSSFCGSDIPINIPIYPQKSSNISSRLNVCRFCAKTLSSYKNKWRHEKTCKEKNDKINEDIRENGVSKDNLIEQLANKDTIIVELKKQIEVLLGKVGNTTNIQQNIYINAFGNENTEYIKGDYVKRLLKGVHGYDFIPNLLKDIHFNPEHQENWNVCIPNKKQAFAKVYDGDKWVYRKKKNTIENMTDKAYKTLIDTYDENENKSWKNIVDDGLYYDDNNTKDLIEKNTEIMILNNQNEV